MDRFRLIKAWLRARCGAAPEALQPASADASFRRYFRATYPNRTFIVMDAPPEREDCRPFLHVARLLAAAGVHVPEVLEQDLEQGFLLLSDLGNVTYLEALSDPTADALYGDAIAALIQIQRASRPDALPRYDEALLRRELMLFAEWYVGRHLGASLTPSRRQVLEQAFDKILRVNLAEAPVFVHRDYHCRNLMVAAPNPGILDFQDAVFGPASYDLVSLLKDAYVAWDERRVEDWAARYWQQARQAGLPLPPAFADFLRDFDWMGVQRHLKILGIFARLWHRDGKSGYLRDMPRVLGYLRAACARYGELHPLLGLLDELPVPIPAVETPL